MRRSLVLLVWAAVWVLVCGSGARVEAANALSEATSRAFDADPKAFVRHMESYVGTVVARRFHVQEYLPKARDRQRYAQTKAALLETQAETHVSEPFIQGFQSHNSSGSLQLLGEGSFGSVFKARDLINSPHADVAIKLIGTFHGKTPYVHASDSQHNIERPQRNGVLRGNMDLHGTITESMKNEIEVYRQLSQGLSTPPANIIEFKGIIVSREPQSYNPEHYEAFDMAQLKGAPMDNSIQLCIEYDASKKVKAVHPYCLRGLWMEICTYGDIATAVEKNVYEPPIMLRFFSQAMNGVRTFHQRTLTHNDLKPSNILLCKGDANRITAKVTDFGTVSTDDKRVDDPFFQIGPHNLPTGTMAYHPPEAINCGPKVGLGDVFDMGLVGAEMLGNLAESEKSAQQCESWTNLIYLVFQAWYEQEAARARDPAIVNTWKKEDILTLPDLDKKYRMLFKMNLKDCEATRRNLILAQLTHPELDKYKWKARFVNTIIKMEACDVWSKTAPRPTSEQAYQEIEAIVKEFHIAEAPVAGPVETEQQKDAIPLSENDLQEITASKLPPLHPKMWTTRPPSAPRRDGAKAVSDSALARARDDLHRISDSDINGLVDGLKGKGTGTSTARDRLRHISDTDINGALDGLLGGKPKSKSMLPAGVAPAPRLHAEISSMLHNLEGGPKPDTMQFNLVKRRPVKVPGPAPVIPEIHPRAKHLYQDKKL